MNGVLYQLTQPNFYKFWLRYLNRLLILKAAPRVIGPRDRICGYEIDPPHVPDEPLEDFIRQAIQEQGLQAQTQEILTFLDYWLPIQVLGVAGRVAIEFLVTTNRPCLGMMLYGRNDRIEPAFGDFCRLIDQHSPTVDACCEICRCFSDSDVAMVRSEFQPGMPARYSIASSWHLDILRGHGCLQRCMERLPSGFDSLGLIDAARSVSALLAPDFYPLHFGMSFGGDGALEPKLYLIRFDRKRSPLYRGSTLWRFIERMGVSATSLEQIKMVNSQLWGHSLDKMTQIGIELSETTMVPRRINLIYGSVPTNAIRLVIDQLDHPASSLETVDNFERILKSYCAKYVAMRVTPEGISKRIKLYEHAVFKI